MSLWVEDGLTLYQDEDGVYYAWNEWGRLFVNEFYQWADAAPLDCEYEDWQIALQAALLEE